MPETSLMLSEFNSYYVKTTTAILATGDVEDAEKWG